MKDQSIIPPGSFCYRVVRIFPGEVLSKDIDRFGKYLREFSWHGEFKEVLCPYWRKTDYGMVKCEFMGIESLDEDESGAKQKALVHFGSEAALAEANKSCWLFDEIKICNVKKDGGENWENNHSSF